MNKNENRAIEDIKKDEEYLNILQDIKKNKYNMYNVAKLMKDTTNGDYTEYEIAESIVYFVKLLEKQQKEIEGGYHKGFIDGRISMKYESQDKIIKKIEELEEEKEKYFEKQVIQGRIDLLNELLEEN